jgi:hypothetical protein
LPVQSKCCEIANDGKEELVLRFAASAVRGAPDRSPDLATY